LLLRYPLCWRRRLADVLAKDVAAFNATVSALGVAPIVVVRKGKPIA
jgi:hypothetical protein